MNTLVITRVPEAMSHSLDEVAKLSNRKRGAILRDALAFYLEEWADYQIAVSRLADPTDEMMTGEDFKEMMKKEHGWAL